MKSSDNSSYFFSTKTTDDIKWYVMIWCNFRVSTSPAWRYSTLINDLRTLVFQLHRSLQSAWRGRTLTSLVINGGGLVFSKMFFLLQLLQLLSPEDFMLWLQIFCDIMQRAMWHNSWSKWRYFAFIPFPLIHLHNLIFAM